MHQRHEQLNRLRQPYLHDLKRKAIAAILLMVRLDLLRQSFSCCTLPI
jgi:hypothetical protein